MITVVSGTNRPNSKTKLVADYVYNLLQTLNYEVRFIDMVDVAAHIDLSTMYTPDSMATELQRLQDDVWIPSDKLIVIGPEYNGSFAGILKLFIDAISVRKYAETFQGKKALLIGVASGRAGNLRGMEHLTGFLNYLKVNVYPAKLPISSISQQIEDGELNASTKEAINQHVNGFLSF